MGKYIDKIEFHTLLKKYRDLNYILDDSIDAETDTEYSKKYLEGIRVQSDKVYNQIGKRFLLIATNYLNKPSYINYTADWKDDMVSEAVYDMVRYMHNYDVDLMEETLEGGGVPDPFAYFSIYVYNGIMRVLRGRKGDKNFLVRLPFIENMDKRDISYD